MSKTVTTPARPKTPRKAVFIVGVPGTGKSTLTKLLMRYLETTFAEVTTNLGFKLVPFTEYRKPEAREWRVLGVFDETLTYVQGTDRMSMGAQPNFEAFLNSNRANLLIEGDRLANLKSIAALTSLDYEIKVLALQVDPDELQRRYAQRGSNQSESFIKGRYTKVENLMSNLAKDFPNVVAGYEWNNTPEQQAVNLGTLIGLI